MTKRSSKKTLHRLTEKKNLKQMLAEKVEEMRQERKSNTLVVTNDDKILKTIREDIKWPMPHEFSVTSDHASIPYISTPVAPQFNPYWTYDSGAVYAPNVWKYSAIWPGEKIVEAEEKIKKITGHWILAPEDNELNKALTQIQNEWDQKIEDAKLRHKRELDDIANQYKQEMENATKAYASKTKMPGPPKEQNDGNIVWIDADDCSEPEDDADFSDIYEDDEDSDLDWEEDDEDEY